MKGTTVADARRRPFIAISFSLSLFYHAGIKFATVVSHAARKRKKKMWREPIPSVCIWEVVQVHSCRCLIYLLPEVVFAAFLLSSASAFHVRDIFGLACNVHTHQQSCINDSSLRRANSLARSRARVTSAKGIIASIMMIICPLEALTVY